MDPTTLMTFLFETTPDVRLVELLGSWDNFRQPYFMHHDRRRGKGFWTGCFRFNNIIFDGDRSQRSRPRQGGLKQGGTYWYFYRLDDEIEACDAKQSQTSSCPLLPGQPMNIVEVPIELVEAPNRSRSASVDFAGALTDRTEVHTWNPADKFMALKPPSVSKVHGRYVSDLELGTQLKDFKLDVYSSPSTARSQASSSGSFSAKSRSSQYAPIDSMECALDHVAVGCQNSACCEHEQTCAQTSTVLQPAAIDINIKGQMAETCLCGPGSADAIGDSEKLECMNSTITTVNQPELLQDTLSDFARPPTALQSVHSIENRVPRQASQPKESYKEPHQHRSDSTGAPSVEYIERSCPDVRISQDMPHDEQATDEEVWSPALSTDTASSGGGFGTPHRSGEREWPISSLHEHPALMDHVSQRLQDLQIPSEEEQEPHKYSRSLPLLPIDPPLQRYSLPYQATEILQLRNELSSYSMSSSIHDQPRQYRHFDLPIPSALDRLPSIDPLNMTSTHGASLQKTSLADDISLELGFLEMSIL